MLIRELMVWCWQQEERDRPSSAQIMDVARADQFLRLADAIRINNFGSQVLYNKIISNFCMNSSILQSILEHFFFQLCNTCLFFFNLSSQVTGSCCRIVKSSYQKHSMTPVTPSGFFSPRYTAYPNRRESGHQFFREVKTISSSQPYRPRVDIENRSFSLGGTNDDIALGTNVKVEKTLDTGNLNKFEGIVIISPCILLTCISCLCSIDDIW